jgi:hypothetical protein
MRIYDIDGAAGRNFQLEPVSEVSADEIISSGVLHGGAAGRLRLFGTGKTTGVRPSLAA